MDELNGLLSAEAELIGEFTRLTEEQHGILSGGDVDERELDKSLAARRAVLNRLGDVFGKLANMPGAAESREGTVAALERMRRLDGENLALCEKHMQSLGGQAKKMSQNRKVVTGYGKSVDAALNTSGFFDKRQ